jgi:peroxiredoxin
MKIRNCALSFTFFVVAFLCVSFSTHSLAQETGRFTSSAATRSILDFGWLTNQSGESQRLAEIIGEDSQTISWHEIKDGVTRLGLPLHAKKLSLQQIQEQGGAALVYLHAPEQLVCVSALSRDNVFVYEQGEVKVVALKSFARRYSGEALRLIVSEKKSGLKINTPLTVVPVTSSGEEVNVVVPVFNQGRQTLNLDIEKTSCSCTSNKDSVRVLQPGQRGSLHFVIHSSGWGTRFVSATIRTNDPFWPRFMLLFQVDVPPSVVPSPSRLTIQGNEGEAIERTLVLFLPDKASILKTTALNSFISARLIRREAIANNMSSHRINVNIAANAPTGAFKDQLIFDLKNANVPRISVPVEGTIDPDITVEPRQIFWGPATPGSHLAKTLRIQSRSGKLFAINSLKTQNVHLKVEANTVESAVSHIVEVSGDIREHNNAIFRDVVKIQLSTNKLLEVPVFASVSRRDNEDASPKPGVHEAEKLPRAEVDPNNHIAVVRPLVRVGEDTPDFNVVDMNGQQWSIEGLKGKKNLLLTFFPKCFTGGCANHLSSLRDLQEAFDTLDTQILAVSVDAADGQKGQKEFAAQWKLSFPLIPDTKRQLSMLFGAVKNDNQLAGRMTIFIDKQGIVRFIDSDVNVMTHGADVLARMKELGLGK